VSTEWEEKSQHISSTPLPDVVVLIYTFFFSFVSFRFILLFTDKFKLTAVLFCPMSTLF
jgi:hypothetical protein